jgi:CDP-diacylglycerol--serine O-phosphatidyltransferase
MLVGGRGLVRRVGRRRGETGVTAVMPATPRYRSGAPVDRAWPGASRQRPAGAPVSPAMPPLADHDVGPISIPLLPGERTLDRKIKFLVANGCTVGSLLLGMTAVFLAIHGEIRVAAVALLACVVLDGCDGGLARLFGVASPFGAQMDSLADLSSFGVATGIVVFQWLTLSDASPAAAAPACALVAVCAAIRLARFNVSPKDGRYFSGVPTTMTAAVLALATQFSPPMPASLQVVAVAIFALAMVSSFPYAKLMQVLRLPPWIWVVPAIGLLINPSMTFVLVVLAYLASGPLLWLRQRNHNHTARTA